MKAIKNLGNSVYIKGKKYLDLFNLEKKEWWEKKQSASRLLLRGRKIAIIYFYNG